MLSLVDAKARASEPAAAATPDLHRHLRHVWRYLRMHGATPHEADDLTQEACVIALQKGALALDPAACFTFLQRTARFRFLRLRRGGAEAERLADAVDALWASDCGTDGGDRRLAALQLCLQKLTPRAREALQAAYGLGGNTTADRADVAHRLGLAADGLKTLLQRARQQLRACIDGTPHDD